MGTVALNRRRYGSQWQLIENAKAGETIEITGRGKRTEANRVRTALQTMARYRKIKLVTSIQMPEADIWRLTLLKL
jgi:hypothetical protein